jgi:hypothetical protein
MCLVNATENMSYSARIEKNSRRTLKSRDAPTSAEAEGMERRRHMFLSKKEGLSSDKITSTRARGNERKEGKKYEKVVEIRKKRLTFSTTLTSVIFILIKVSNRTDPIRTISKR